VTEPTEHPPTDPAAPAVPDAPTAGERRRAGLRTSRWVVGGVAVGATAFLTGVIAGSGGAVTGGTDATAASRSDRARDHDDDRDRNDDRDDRDDEYRRARPSAPRSVPMGGAWNRAGTGVAPGNRAVPGNPSAGGTNPSSQSRAPQTRSRGS